MDLKVAQSPSGKKAQSEQSARTQLMRVGTTIELRLRRTSTSHPAVQGHDIDPPTVRDHQGFSGIQQRLSRSFE